MDARGGIFTMVPVKAPSTSRLIPRHPPHCTMVTEDVTTLLLEWRQGDRQALDALFPLVEEELRRRAHHYLDRERTDHTLSTTALVHEAYLKLIRINEVEWQDRAHFMAVAATAMRRVLVGYARKYNAQKRGGDMVRLSLDEAPTLAHERSDQMLALDDALERLSRLNERLGRTVELRFFGGLTIQETAEVLDVATSTVKLDWEKARAWLYRELR